MYVSYLLFVARYEKRKTVLFLILLSNRIDVSLCRMKFQYTFLTVATKRCRLAQRKKKLNKVSACYARIATCVVPILSRSLDWNHVTRFTFQRKTQSPSHHDDVFAARTKVVCRHPLFSWQRTGTIPTLPERHRSTTSRHSLAYINAAACLALRHVGSRGSY